MSRISQTFAALKAENRTAFMPYLMAGDPDLDATRKLILAMAEAGADLIELGVPFSDPLADGPTNQLAAERALQSGTTLDGIFAMVRELRKDSQIPVCLMGYYNPFFHYGLEAFCRNAAEAGVDGLIIPDLQPDDVAEIRPHADAAGLDTVFLIAPTSTPERLACVSRESRGFVYAVSLTGVTGTRTELPPELGSFLELARKHIDLPIAVGFGISNAEMAKGVSAVADGVIVGSAIVKRIAESVEKNADPLPPVKAFVATLSEAMA